jgi:pimeloyl-ACP methyl ester carboxylesterase
MHFQNNLGQTVFPDKRQSGGLTRHHWLNPEQRSSLLNLTDRDMQRQSFRISRIDAPTLSLHAWGSGEPTFLLIHGFGDGGFIWNDFSPRLTPLGRVIAIDLRGHGDSDWDARSRYGAAAHLTDVMFVVNSLDLRNVVLIGHSLGGEIAIRFTALHPERVTGIVIVDFGPELNRTATAHIRREFIAESRSYASHAEYASHLELKLPLLDPKLCRNLVKSALRPSPQGGYQLKRDPAIGLVEPVNAGTLPGLWPMLNDIPCPALIIRGVASSVLPLSIAKRMVDVLPNASLASVELAGHAVMTDNPQGFADAVLSFVTKVSAPNWA